VWERERGREAIVNPGRHCPTIADPGGDSTFSPPTIAPVKL